MNRRNILGTIGVGLLSLLPFGANAGGETCNTDGKCESKCGVEKATCCNGRCVRGCGPRRFRNPNTCKCCKRTRSGRFDCADPNFCGE